MPKALHSPVEHNNTGSFFTLVLALVPILGSVGFIVAYFHEVGYTSTAGLPIELIWVDTTILGYILPSLLLALLIGISLGVWGLIYILKAHGAWQFVAYINLVATPIFIYASMKQFFGGISPWVSVGLLIFQPLILYFALRKKNLNINNLEDKISKKWPAWLIGGVMGLFMIAYLSGIADFRFQRTYFIPSTNPNSVVLRIYGDNLICAPLTDNSSIESSFFILKIDKPNLILSQREFKSHLWLNKR